MSVPSARKRLKQRARQKSEARKRLLFERRQRYKQDFPGFTWRTDGAPDEFVQSVKEAVGSLDFRDRTVFPQPLGDLFKAAKRFGGSVLAQAAGVNDIELPVGVILGMHLGQLVFSRIPKLLDWIPFNDVEFVPREKDILVKFRSLLRAKGPGGTVYYSRHKPTLDIDGRKRLVGFSDHAVRQICDRVVPDLAHLRRARRRVRPH